MANRPNERWWTIRRAQNRKPATYRCPLCGNHLPALLEHVLIAPEGDLSRRRHAHTECVLKARRAGGMLSKEEWVKTQPQPPRRPLRQRLAELLGRGQRVPDGPE
jgi:hypothetical protein